ncbi:unnamed protein product, partial [Nesidiocoris tenuis]
MVEELLIEKVRHYVFLYDKTHEDYRDSNVRQAAWKEIGKELQMSVFRVADFVDTRARSRECWPKMSAFRRYLRIVRANGNKLQPAQPSCRFTGGRRSVRVSHVTAVQIFARTAASNEVLDCLIAPERGGGNRFDDNQHAQLIAYASPRER